jgi:hypothetical protein
MSDDTGKPKAEDAQRLTLAAMAFGFAEALSVEMAVAKQVRCFTFQTYLRVAQ